MTKTKVLPVIIVLALLTLAGMGAWIYQLANGLAVTGMNNGTSWGLYITCFMFFVGLSAGGLIVASSASVFGIKDYKKVARPAILLSTVCIVAAAAFILVDLGSVQRVFNLIIHPNFTSPLMWDVVVITLYLVINIIYLVLMTRSSSGERALAVTSRFALPVAILVHSVTAWIFGLQIAKAGWYSAILAPLFVASALDSGLALLLIVLGILNATGTFKTEKRLLTSLAGLLVVCIAIDGFMVGCEVLTMAYPGADATVLAVMTSGATAPLFWGEVVIGLIVPFCLLVFSRIRENMVAVTVVSALVVVGVFFKRAWLLLSSFGPLNIEGAPGVTYGRSALEGTGMWELVGSYMPTWVEGMVALGIIALATLLFVLLAQKVLVTSDKVKAAPVVAVDGDAAQEAVIA
ncbi:MAG: polysulfide reductase NrfD [Coriobacteriales bacterium]|jgi:molybdopterin-containing oxidoreductase family membrane subunit|nr:polysulfide reductase NrfD [Coriobacteriales bacterium]